MIIQDATKHVIKKPTLLATLVAYVNPVTLVPALVIGAVGVVAYKSAKQVKTLRQQNSTLQHRNKHLQQCNENLSDELEYYEAEWEEWEEGESDNEPSETVNNGSLTVQEPLEATAANRSPTVESTVQPPLPAVNSTAQEPLYNGSLTEAEAETAEQARKAQLSAVMSELGKKSAEARKRKREETEQEAKTKGA